MCIRDRRSVLCLPSLLPLQAAVRWGRAASWCSRPRLVACISIRRFSYGSLILPFFKQMVRSFNPFAKLHAPTRPTAGE
eukprot:4694267-Pyramimonas_sp.AAC.2